MIYATGLNIKLDGEKVSLLQNISITGGIGSSDDLLLTVDGEKLLYANEDDSSGTRKLKLKNPLPTDTSEEILERTTLSAEAKAKGGRKVALDSIEISSNGATTLNLVTIL